jgi:hypothetical protein
MSSQQPPQYLMGPVSPDSSAETRSYFISNLIASCAQPDTSGPFDEVPGR